jgi:hypothetical protein
LNTVHQPDTPVQAPDEAVPQGTLAILNPVHRAYLNEHAITDEVIRAALIFSSAQLSLPAVPDPSGFLIQFPWRDDPEVTIQARMWPEPPEGLGDRKYLWNNGYAGRSTHFWALRPVKADGGPVLIVEGTKQSLAVASWAPADYAVYGISGCDAWRNLEMARLDRFAGRQVIIMLDADATTNLRVYEGGEGLARELRMDDAIVTFVPSPSWGKGGIDDYLAQIDGPRRTERLAKLIASAGAKAADRKPRAKPSDAGPVTPDTNGLPLVVVNQDRLQVINEILYHMRVAFADRLFSYGGVITRLREEKTEPLDKDSFARWMSTAVGMYKYRAPSMAAPGSYEAAWPEQQTIGALLASGDDFPELARVSQSPFIRPDGSVCAKNGYDPDSKAMLVMGNSGMDQLQIPEHPTQLDAATAAAFLLDEWLGDMPFRDEASRANALALALTPFIRGLVPLVPLAVISGLQMGVGKNLLADCLSIMITGQMVQTLPWIPDDDDENRKQILAAFRGGTSLFCLDEAHDIAGTALARAITSTTYADRILGVSKQAAYPNTVTWMSLGNQVTIRGDMARRAYVTELYPSDPDPQDRPDTMFRHPDLRGWTTASRPKLVHAALTLIRAWYAAGEPAYRRSTLMGSFETWDKMMTSVLGFAGVPGFLDNLTTRRAERDTTGGYWTEHLAWLRGQFGGATFTCMEVRQRAMSSAGTWDAPPRLHDPMPSSFTRELGQAYGRNAERWHGQLRLVKTGTGHGTKVQWVVQERGGGEIHPIHPIHPQGHTLPDLGGMDRMDQAGQAQAPPAPPAASGGTVPDLGFSETSVTAHASSPGEMGVKASWDGSDRSFLPFPTRTPARLHAHTRTRVGEGWRDPSDPSAASAPFIGFDIETADAEDIFRWPRGQAGEDGIGYVRLAGVIGPGGSALIRPEHLTPVLASAARVDGHNIMGFDGVAMAHHHGLDIHQLAAVAFDTELAARQAKPPRSRESGSSKDRYGLDVVAGELGLPGKTDELPRLARKHGGYEHIPPDDEEYREYLRGDLAATAGVATALLDWNATPYVRREHRVAALGAQMTLNGFAVDAGLLARRYDGEQAKKRAALQALSEEFGLPLTKPVLRGRGAARAEIQEPQESPLASKIGKAWLEQVFAGVPDPPRTPSSRDIATGADEMARVAARPDCPAPIRRVIDLMAIATGARTVYQTATAWLCPDGRVHPRNSFRQASGRWSVLNPGMTVFGKHDGRHIERDVFTADEPGWVTISFDLAQVDMRAIAGHSQDPEYIKLFLPGRDAHAEIAMRVFGTAKRRQDAKARGHGWNYGMGPERMIRDGIDPAMAYGFDHGMRESFPVMCSWREQIRALGQQGRILDNGFGRRMRCEPKWAHTVAPALMGQGGARDIMCESLLRLPAWTWPYLRAMVHDEIVMCVPLELLRALVAAVTQAMTWTWRGVPILCDINGPGWSWGDINAKCQACGATHGPGYCELHAELKKIAAKHEMERAA